MAAKVRRIIKRQGGHYGAFIDQLERQGAILCPTCGDYAVHTMPCQGWSAKFGGGGMNLCQPYHMTLAGGLEADQLEAEADNAQEAA